MFGSVLYGPVYVFMHFKYMIFNFKVSKHKPGYSPVGTDHITQKTIINK